LANAARSLGCDLGRLVAAHPPFGEAEHGCDVPIEDLREPIGLGQRARDHRRVAWSRRHHLLFADRTGKFHAGIVPVRDGGLLLGDGPAAEVSADGRAAL
jgi:hypothetical protein